ncbi:MAG TPA: TonB-dependent receptor [Woeseiaceae bacterium]|nr:TonB-dependent receptor [Woeseiaceae bacterium]
MSKSNAHIALTIGLGVLSTAVPLVPASVAAQQQGDTVLEEITVTASRREESLQDAAVAVTVLDVGTLADAGLNGLPEVLGFVPGVSVVDTGANFNNQVYIRGINAVLAAGVATYVDEIPFGSSTVYTTPAPLDGTLLDIDSLNVLKGPQGTLYGASAMGGILKYATRDPSLDEWTGSVSADLSDTSGGGMNQVYRVNGNGPVATDTLGVSFTGFWSDAEGYIDNVAIPREGWDDYEYYGASGSVLWQITDRLDVSLQGLYQNSTQEGVSTIQANYADGELLPGVGEGEPWFGEYETGEADINPSEFDASLVGLTIDYDLGFATLTSVTSSQELQFVQSQDLTAIYAGFADFLFPDNAPHTSVIFTGDLGFDKVTQELRLTSPSNESFEWIVGAYYTDEEGHNIQRLDTQPPEDFYFANFPSNYEEVSAFATGTFYFTPDFDVSLGVRYADYSNDVVLNAIGPLVAPIPQTSIEDEVTNYLLNARWRIGDDTSVYGRVATGYRPGGANFLLLDPISGEPLTNPFFEADSLTSFEAGIRGSVLDGRLGYDLGAFYIDWQDYQIGIVRGGLQVAGNADQAASRGAEALVTFAATDALTIKAMVAYTNAELAADEPDLGGADGEQLPNSPEWQSALDVDYRFDVAAVPAYVGLSWRYKGDMPVGFPGYTDGDGTFWEPSAPRLTIDGYSVVDARAGVTLGAVDLALYVTNLLDEWAYTNFGASFTGPSLATPTRPRTVGAIARFNFD